MALSWFGLELHHKFEIPPTFVTLKELKNMKICFYFSVDIQNEWSISSTLLTRLYCSVLT